ncbi:MAG TPA: LTA synthase family protein, partial [Bacteroidia bacterium]|nr:LTA synthase family protein [Bacteroidia bacterium]
LILLHVSNLFLYRSWGVLINYRALSFLADWRQMFLSVNNFELIVGIICIILLFILTWFVFRKFTKHFFDNKLAIIQSLLQFIVSAAMLVIMFRGGVQMLPVNESAAAFSENVTLNHIATNPAWHLGHNLNQAKSENASYYKFYSDAVAEEHVKKLFQTPIDLMPVLNNKKPNIVIIMLESFTVDVVGSMGGETGVSPTIDSLIHDGLSFKNIYSSGARTDQAFVAVLSGFPAQPNQSIMRFPDKTAKLPSLPAELKKQGYSTSFYYGGDLDFSNLNTYLVNCGFEQITGKKKFKQQQLSAKWGAHDEFVFEKNLNDLNQAKEPFFSVVMTLSSHEPYDIPIQSPFGKDNPNEQFKGSAWYADHSLGNYLAAAKKEPWFKNTLFVIVADHGNKIPRDRSYYSHYIRHIPMVMAGDVVKNIYKNKIVYSTGSHHDIPSTLLHQLGFNSDMFNWSNDLLNRKRNGFAYLCMDDAEGWVTDSCTFVYDLSNQKFIYKRPYYAIADTVTAKSYLQQLYSTFSNL